MSKRKRILVVDDDHAIRQMYRTALTMAGFRTDTASDGMSALRMIDERRPDLIVLDLHLPQVDGLTVLSELRANSDTGDIPVVVLTGTDFNGAVVQGSTVLKKPCEPEQLIDVIQRHLWSVV